MIFQENKMFTFAKIYNINERQVLFTLTPSEWDKCVPIVKVTTFDGDHFKVAIKKFKKGKNGHHESIQYFDNITEADAQDFLNA